MSVFKFSNHRHDTLAIFFRIMPIFLPTRAKVWKWHSIKTNFIWTTLIQMQRPWNSWYLSWKWQLGLWRIPVNSLESKIVHSFWILKLLSKRILWFHEIMELFPERKSALEFAATYYSQVITDQVTIFGS